jgi:hypothetical protein
LYIKAINITDNLRNFMRKNNLQTASIYYRCASLKTWRDQPGVLTVIPAAQEADIGRTVVQG